VKQGEILLDLRILNRWDSAGEDNEGKEGRQYAYTEIFASTDWM